MTAIVKITGDHVIVYGAARKVLRRGDMQEIPRSELEQWKKLYQIEVLKGDVYSGEDLPRLQQRAKDLQTELIHVMRGLAECAEALDVPIEEALSTLQDVDYALLEEKELAAVDILDDEPQLEPAEQDLAELDPLSLIGGDWEELRAFVAENADPHPGPSRTAHEEWIQETYGGE